MSIGFMVDEDTPMIWRGPMVTSALQQLLTETNWDGLDYLVVDLPPGTGDIQLTLAQKVPVSGCLIVTTPQDIALLDARKAVQMFRKVEMSVLGIVENMSTHICSQCGHEEPIFGSGGGARMAEQYGIPLLGQLPLDLRIREDLDHGRPTVVSAPDSELSLRYRDVARSVAARLSMTPRSLAVSLPQINIRDS
jgi:ATP-binding protein involved in chromosome partitioning